MLLRNRLLLDSVSPLSLYDFAAGAGFGSLPNRVSFTRASSATRRNASGLIETVGTDVPAFHYSTAGVARGLRIFGAATNMVKQGTTIGGTSQTVSPTRGSLTVNATTSPDGTVNAARFVEDTSGTTHYLYCGGLSVTVGTSYTCSVFAKAGERTWVGIQAYSSNGFVSPASGMAYFNLATGVIGSADSVIEAYGIEDAGNGWYRCWARVTAAATTGDARFGVHLCTGNLAQSYTGDGTSGAYFWGLQVEAVAGPTSFIPTTTATATRAADTALITNGRVLTDQAWIIRARTATFTPTSGSQSLFLVDDGTTSNRRFVYRDSSNKIQVLATSGGVAQCVIDLGTVANDTDFAVAVRWADNNFAASLNGGAIVTDLVGANPPGLTAARIGINVTGGSVWNSTIRSIETRRTATDAELPLLCA